MMELVLIHSKNPLACILSRGLPMRLKKKKGLSVCEVFTLGDVGLTSILARNRAWQSGYSPNKNNNDSNNNIIPSVLC